MKSRTLQIAACLLILAPRASLAQEKKAAPEPAKQEAAASSWPAADPKDVASLDAIVAAVYNVISGPAGDRDWNRFRSLFTPDGRLVPLVKKPDGTFTHRTLAVEDYAKNGAEYFRKEGFYESELARRTEQFGQLAVVFTTYASRHAPDEKPFARGINSMTFYNDGKRWYCLSVIWDSERPDNPIPDKYLK
jgi:hypothetical protein